MKLKNVMKRFTFYNVKKGVLYLKQYGPKDFLLRLSERFKNTEVDYHAWFCEHLLTPEMRRKQEQKDWENPCLMSVVVPIYRTPEVYLEQMIESVQNQTYPHWELCIADGSGDVTATKAVVEKYQSREARIKYQKLQDNQGIAGNTNKAMAMATGEYVCLLDHDDLLTEDALYEMATAIETFEFPEVLYSDEDKVTADLSEYIQPHFKPDFNLDLLRANNYICHMFVVKRTLLERIGGQNSEFDGAQDYDFIFRCVEQAGQIVHIPKILYHWRIHQGSTADNPVGKDYALLAGKRAIAAHLLRMNVSGEVTMTKDRGFYRVKYPVQGTPLVSIIIPNKDAVATLKRCLDSIHHVSTYRNYEIVIVENNSTEEETFGFYQSIDGQNGVRVVYWDKEFNYSAINNFGAACARGEYFLLLNNDVSVITPDWLEELLGHCQRSEVGIVGVRLYFPNDTMQHAGIVVGIGGCAGNLFVGMKRGHTGYLHKAVLQQNLSAVTAACLMVKKAVFEAVGGLEEELAVAFNDVDFCLRVRKLGYLVVYNPYAELYHYESQTRGYEDTEEKKQRFQREKDYLCRRWETLLEAGDPYYNKNLSLKTCEYEIKQAVTTGVQ